MAKHKKESTASLDEALAVLSEALSELEYLEHGPTCYSWSGKKDAQCDCNWGDLISRIKKVLGKTGDSDEK
jgi:hypothetical protein